MYLFLNVECLKTKYSILFALNLFLHWKKSKQQKYQCKTFDGYKSLKSDVDAEKFSFRNSWLNSDGTKILPNTTCCSIVIEMNLG